MTEINEGRKTREDMNFCISLLSYDKEIIENQNKLGDKKTVQLQLHTDWASCGIPSPNTNFFLVGQGQVTASEWQTHKTFVLGSEKYKFLPVHILSNMKICSGAWK